MSFLRTLRSPDRFSAGNSGEILLEKFDYDINGNLIYQGACNNPTIADNADSWYLCKFTYDGDNKLIRTEYMYNVAWSERAILGWIV